MVAIDPRTGAVLAMTSTPTFNATPISGDPARAGPAMRQIRNQPGNPLVARDRQGHYTPGSIMKVVTAAAGWRPARSPQTTFPIQPRQEVEGFVVDGFRVLEHDLGGVQPALWALSEALQVSSNIFFAHVGLEVGPEAYLDEARAFGFCSGLGIGDPDRALPVAASYVTTPQDDNCAPFTDRAELAQASFGQGRVSVTPVRWRWWRRPSPTTGSCRRRTSSATCVRQPAGTRAKRPGGRDDVAAGWEAGELRHRGRGSVGHGRRGRGPLGRLYAGAGAVSNFGRPRRRTAGKTGTAELGPGREPHSWFIGFAPAQGSATPAIAVAVIVEGGGSGSGRAAPIGGAVMAEWLKILGSGG